MEELRKQSQQIQKLELHNISSKMNIDSFQIMLIQHKIDKLYSSWIQALEKYFSIESCSFSIKNIIISYIFSQYSDDILAKNEMDQTIKQYSDQLIQKIKHVIELIVENTQEDINKDTIQDLYDSMVFYNQEFIKWKKGDSNLQMNHLIQLHCQLEVNKVTTEDKESVEKIELLMKSIKQYIEIIKGKEGLEDLKQAKYDMVAFDPSTIDAIEARLHKCFWEMITNDLKENPPNWKHFPNLVKDCNMYIKNILNHNKLVVDLVDKELNSESITSMIKDGSFSMQNIYNILVFTLHQIKQLGPAIRDNQVAELIISVHNTMKEPSKIIIHEFIPTMMKECLDRLKQIEQEKTYFKEKIENSKNDNIDKNNNIDKNEITNQDTPKKE